MKHSGLLHPQLSALVAAAGHTQTILVADTGMPIPEGVTRIELGVAAGLPCLLDVLRAILGELVVEGVTIAQETAQHSPEWHRQLLSVLPVTPQEISHEELKARLPSTLAVVRTGETTPYANVLLHCGVNF